MLSVFVDWNQNLRSAYCTVRRKLEHNMDQHVLAMSLRKLFLVYCSLFKSQSLCIFSFLGWHWHLFSQQIFKLYLAQMCIWDFWVQVYKMKLLKHCPCLLRFVFCCPFVEQHLRLYQRWKKDCAGSTHWTIVIMRNNMLVGEYTEAVFCVATTCIRET